MPDGAETRNRRSRTRSAPYLSVGVKTAPVRAAYPDAARRFRMLRRAILGTAAATLALTLSASITLAGNPSGTGQPSTSCDNPGAIAPNGFGTAGFANAESHYANPDSQG